MLNRMSSLYILEIKPWCVIGQYGLPYSQFPFYFDDGFFILSEAF